MQFNFHLAYAKLLGYLHDQGIVHRDLKPDVRDLLHIILFYNLWNMSPIYHQ
jgi:hypothetical protein